MVSLVTIDLKKGSRGQLWYCMNILGELDVVSWFDIKLVSILSIGFNPINLIGFTVAIWWHLIDPLETPTNPTLMHYQKHMHKVDVQDQLCDNFTL
jgi:hypothetical protein